MSTSQSKCFAFGTGLEVFNCSTNHQACLISSKLYIGLQHAIVSDQTCNQSWPTSAIAANTEKLPPLTGKPECATSSGLHFVVPHLLNTESHRKQTRARVQRNAQTCKQAVPTAEAERVTRALCTKNINQAKHPGWTRVAKPQE